MKINFLSICLLLLSFYAYGQSVERSATTDLEKAIEDYIIEQLMPTHYHSIEFAEKEVFNLEQLVKDYKVPQIFKNNPQAIEQNKEAFDWLETISKEHSIAYTVPFVFGLRDNDSEPWNPYWVLVLLDTDLNVVGYFFYKP